MRLAIKGHSTRGKEVIETLEMLGGKNLNNLNGASNKYYLISLIVHKILSVDKLELNKSNELFAYFTLEEFLEKFPYKVGDEVEYKSIGDANLKSKIIYMEWNSTLNKVLYTTEDAQVISTEDITKTKSIPPYMDYDIKENIEKNQPPKTQADVDKYLQEHSVKNGMNVIDIETCLEMDGLKLPENVVINSKGIGSIQFIQWYEKSQYPKTYEECCDIVNASPYVKLVYDIFDGQTYSYDEDNLQIYENLRKLKICRDAYWKIAGDEMGLDKPWKPDWYSVKQHKFGIYTFENQIKYINLDVIKNLILVFPTEEMRDAFYENFKDLIEQCKELL